MLLLLPLKEKNSLGEENLLKKGEAGYSERCAKYGWLWGIMFPHNDDAFLGFIFLWSKISCFLAIAFTVISTNQLALSLFSTFLVLE